MENIEELSESIVNLEVVTDSTVLFATHIAANCLVQLEEYNDCVDLLEPFLNKSEQIKAFSNEKLEDLRGKIDVHLMSGTSYHRCDKFVNSIICLLKYFM